jgi:hypothetical protein
VIFNGYFYLDVQTLLKGILSSARMKFAGQFLSVSMGDCRADFGMKITKYAPPMKSWLITVSHLGLYNLKLRNEGIIPSSYTRKVVHKITTRTGC